MKQRRKLKVVELKEIDLIVNLVLIEKNETLESENGQLKEEKKTLEAKVTCSKRIISAQRENSETRQFWHKTNGPIRSQGGRARCYSKPMKDAVLKSLARGVESTSVHRVMTYVAEGLNIDADAVPSLSLINEWRQTDLSVLNDRHLHEFLSSAESITVCLDCASFSDHKASIFVVE